ncbi:MTSS1 protein, partial [Atractosteus spatula]|nr:MTSS1 protein [Atractosteus spatula]
MFQAKRPASTAGIPSNAGPVMVTPGVATIRRTPSTKPSVRRAAVGAGPIPIKTPVIPVKTPTVPDVPGGFPSSLGVSSGEGIEQPSSGVEFDRGVKQATPGEETLSEDGAQDTASPDVQGDNMLLAIRRGVKLKKTTTNDRSAPRIA